MLQEDYTPELLAPAGNMEKLKVAITYGADAVYLSGKAFGLRAHAQNFNLDEIASASTFAHNLGKRIYVTVNVFARTTDIEYLPRYLESLKDIGVDALIISDPGVIMLAQRCAPGIPIHLSTQANTTNHLAIQFWAQQGIKRINISRELSWNEVQVIRKKTSTPLELFVHGSLCMAYSGRCFLSSFMTGRSANLGECTHPCRWRYALIEQKRPGQYLPVFSDARGTYIMSSKDLCLITHMDKLLKAKIDAFKIEGRMRGILAVATMVRSYRSAIDKYLEDPSAYRFNNRWAEELNKISHREYFPGLLFENDKKQDKSFTKASYIRTHNLAGIVKKVLHIDRIKGNTSAEIEVRNRLEKGMQLEFLGRNFKTDKCKLDAMTNHQGQELQYANPNQKIISEVPFRLFENEVIRSSAQVRKKD